MIVSMTHVKHSTQRVPVHEMYGMVSEKMCFQLFISSVGSTGQRTERGSKRHESKYTPACSNKLQQTRKLESSRAIPMPDRDQDTNFASDIQSISQTCNVHRTPSLSKTLSYECSINKDQTSLC